MIRINTGDYVSKYPQGKWVWNEANESFEFDAIKGIGGERMVYVKTGDFKYMGRINQHQELIFRQEFQRSEMSHDIDVIVMQDIKNLVLFLAPKEIISKAFVHFVNTKVVDQLLRALIIYFEYFLKMVEFCLIRRDEATGPRAKVQSDESTEIKRIYSSHLTLRRMMVAREYSRVILGSGEMKGFYHMNFCDISFTMRDKYFHECFESFATQVVWIAHHRRCYEDIDAEIGRLFRSEHFKYSLKNCLEFTKAEMSMLYGKNYKRINYRVQNSPLIQDLMHIPPENLPVLTIGDRKYRGTDYRILQLELEYIVPESQLNLINSCQGILGHPKKFYDTMLRLHWAAVRPEHYTKDYDPYFLVNQPTLDLPLLNEQKLRKNAKQYECFYNIEKHYEPMEEELVRKWIHRDSIISHFMTGKKFLTNVMTKCQEEIENDTYGPSVDQIIAKFMKQKKKLRKN